MERSPHPRTVDKAAEELGMKPTTVRSWIGQRKIGFIWLGRAIRVPASEIERLLESGFVPPKR